MRQKAAPKFGERAVGIPTGDAMALCQVYRPVSISFKLVVDLESDGLRTCARLP